MGSSLVTRGSVTRGPMTRGPMTRGYVTRRHFMGLAGAGLFALCAGGLSGCGEEESDLHTKQGFASDAEIKDYDVTLRVIADENLAYSNNSGDNGRLGPLFLNYQQITGRGNVTFAIKYMDASDMALACMNGFSEQCDMVIGLSDTIDMGVNNGILDGGQGGASVRDLYSALSEKVVIVASSSSGVDMPKASTLSGDDAADGSFTKMMNLPSFDGRIAIGADSLIEGVIANKALYRAGLYTESRGIGGEFVDSIRSKMQVCASSADIANAVISGTCGLGFVLQSYLWVYGTGLTTVYEPSYATTGYKGSAAAGAGEPGVARDFLEYISAIV